MTTRLELRAWENTIEARKRDWQEKVATSARAAEEAKAAGEALAEAQEEYNKALRAEAERRGVA